ncbi:hypothetical protein [uncultured Psychromonas sp.]|uniref:hypothetical protein n=1 Tax=uncultured Psychromonas sp. TaxID=173974 RepID=UPI00260F718A|nr:hypothetical protein [uncultured Psychromonas sp.]
MQNNQISQRTVSKGDLFSSATLSGLITFTLLTFSKNIEATHWAAPFLTDQVIAFISGSGSLALTFLFSLIRYEVGFIINKRDYTKKIDFIEGLISITSCQKKLKELEVTKNKIISEAAKSVLQQKI